MAAVGAVLLLVVAASPSAAVEEGRAVTLEAASCESTATATIRLPSDALQPEVLSPRIGDVVGGTKADVFTKPRLARITGIDVHDATMEVSATGDPRYCPIAERPGEPADGPWIAPIDLDVSYLEPSAAVFPTSCSSDAVVQPRHITVACADGNFYVTGLHWRNWGARVTTASGTGHANRCRPNCVQGRFYTHPARIRLSQRRVCHGDTLQYRRLTVRFAGRTTRLAFGCDPLD